MSQTPSLATQGAYGWLALCHGGFENDCANELKHAAHGEGNAAYEKESGVVRWITENTPPLNSRDFIFSRQVMQLMRPKLLPLDEHNRIDSLLKALGGQQFGAIFLDHPDTKEGKTLQKLFEKLQKPLLSAAEKAGILNRGLPTRLHVVFTTGQTVWLATSLAGYTLPWPMGIPRLKLADDAPNRTTLKLAEAVEFFMPKNEQQDWLREGITAVDLGACPGGWTYFLAKHGVQVIAVDNGTLDERLQHHPLIEHERADGFLWCPSRPVHWVVCDITEKPPRIAELMAHWIGDGLAKRAIFNLKLMSKKRLEEVEYCQEIIEEYLRKKGRKIEQLHFRHLYHDKDEVTGFLTVKSD